MARYKIIRYYKNDRKPKLIATGLTFDEAQIRCSNPQTHGLTFFDGFTEEK